ncbi:FAD-dependent oxidoreductase [Chondrinema litorale]|uniref:FAD-dependent oxidoreductase n=1 Tax=Chondrinema litorale TaxID=2994555 RepID=UPI002542A8A3|nr:FAD-dependent oxidoreductase [Chondrinema litorale]UZR99167.1 FAD-dependent oxidoreductase [Chondrinema litorale]
MIKSAFSAKKRDAKLVSIQTQLAITGGGLSGVCAAITAAREGVKVVLVQDRPVLGGNASSEVRLWILGATSHMGNNNRWSREGGVIDEILIENLYRNKEGNPLILDTIVLEKVKAEKNITLLLNTMVYDLEKEGDNRIKAIKAFCSQNSTEYLIESPLFCDASGDGIIAFKAGSPFRMGAENAEEFDEGFAPNIEDYGELLGHSMYFYTKDTGKPVKFVAPDFALKNIGELPRMRNYQVQDDGCRLWWVEYGGRLDTVHQSEDIKWELWKVIYGIWDYVKNSGEFPEAETLTLEWVGTIPGKRESRRFEGDYILKQADVVEQRQHPDLVAYGGWSLDLHPADGVYSEKMSCNQWHSKGVYGIPYRCYYSSEIENLFLAGRIISASHVAFGSSRVMATCAHGSQAVGMAAVLCAKKELLPRELSNPTLMAELQSKLNLAGQSIPHTRIPESKNLLTSAVIEASSTYKLNELPFNGPWISLKQGAAQLLPIRSGERLKAKLQLRAQTDTYIHVELQASQRLGNFTPDMLLHEKTIYLEKGEQFIELDFTTNLNVDQYVFLLFRENEQVEIRSSLTRMTGLLSVFNKFNKAVSNLGKQEPEEGLGIDTFEFWTPERRPAGHNLAMVLQEPLKLYHPDYLRNGKVRPETKTNAWAASLDDANPVLKFKWDTPKEIRQIRLFFDNDFDHPLESSLMGHPEDMIPFCIKDYRISAVQNESEQSEKLEITTNMQYHSEEVATLTEKSAKIIIDKKGNYQTINTINFKQPLVTSQIELQIAHPSSEIPAALFEVVIS